jgi:putative transposase
MWCDAFSRLGTTRNQTQQGRPGSRSWVTRRTVCGVLICFGANRPFSTHWVLVVMDQWTRRIVGFGVHRGVVDGVALCQMFNRATRGHTPPKHLSSDHDPLYRFHQWQANLRILDVNAIKTVPYAPMSHPFVERLIETIRRECLDRTLFWTAADLEVKLLDFQCYFNGHRAHAGLGGLTPEPRTGEDRARASVSRYRWRLHCRGLYQTPIAA